MRGLVLLVTWSMMPINASNETGVISGIVVNGTNHRQLLAGAEVVLRAGRDGLFSPIANGVTDGNGRFTFTDLATSEDVTYLPGVNRHDVHYPGPRVRLDNRRPRAEVELVAYDAVESPSPLIARRHEISVRIETGFLEIAEALLIENPSRTAYIGEAREDRPPVTLRLTIPDRFETVTFDKEFHGRNFLVHDRVLITDIPWPPGQRELRFTYRLPVEQRQSMFRRCLDLPTDSVTIHVAGKDLGRVECDLPFAASGRDGEVAFAHQGTTLPAGRLIEVRMGALPLRWETYARWVALAVLTLLLAATVLKNRLCQKLLSALPSQRTRRSATGERNRTHERLGRP